MVSYYWLMPTFRHRSPMPVPQRELFEWHSRPGTFQRLTPPWERAELVASSGPWGNGTRWTIRAKLFGPIALNWVAEHYDVKPDEGFSDRQLSGPFARWDHCHEMVPVNEVESELQDSVSYRLPLRLPLGFLIQDRLKTMFEYRHRVTEEDLKVHHGFRFLPRLKIAITGSRGLIGRELTAFLTSGGHKVVRLVRGNSQPPGFDDGTTWVQWDPMEPLPPGTLDGVDAVIHLAGDNLAEGRWTAEKKKKIRDSRVIPTKHIATSVERDRVPVFLSGSAIGGYGDRGEEVLTEDSAFGTGFLADVVREWEEAANCESRVLHLRTGIVLSPRGGALAKQLLPFKLGLGAVLGQGNQYVSWIDINEMVYTIHALMWNPVPGAYNLCSPHPVTNRVFGRTLAKVLNRPFLLTAPRFALNAMFGEMADEALLASQNARPEKLLKSGFTFQHSELEPALRSLLGR